MEVNLDLPLHNNRMLSIVTYFYEVTMLLTIIQGIKYLFLMIGMLLFPKLCFHGATSVMDLQFRISTFNINPSSHNHWNANISAVSSAADCPVTLYKEISNGIY